jgi:hypothetical protein
MNKRRAKTILWVFGGGIVLFLGCSFLISWQLSQSMSDTWKAMEVHTFSCPLGSSVTTRGWSKAGYMRYCEPNKDGPWEAWSEGYRHIQGEYKSRREHGTWYWFNQDGTIQKTVVYDAGNLVSGESP